MAAKTLIAKYWKMEGIPTVYERQVKCQYLLLMNKLTAIKSMNNGSELALRSFSNIWSKFTTYWGQGATKGQFGTNGVRYILIY